MSTQEAEARIARAIEAKAAVLDLRGLGLKALPPLPEGLGGLRSIELGSNRLTSLPDELFMLRALRRIGLGNNRIATLPASVAQLQELLSLDLSENRLEGLPDSIASLARLVEVSLYANRLSELPAGVFALQHLERLDLARNRLSALPSLARVRRSRLRALDASNNQLSRIPEGMHSLRSLRVLSLGGNRLASIEGLEGLLLLEELDVSNNALVSVAPTLRGLPRLKRLDTSGNPIAEDEREAIARYAALREDASAAIGQRISGGESGESDARYFDQAPFEFNADLAVVPARAPDLVDLYYKKSGGQDMSLRLPDGSSLDLDRASRTRALDFTRSAAASEKPVRLQIGQARGREQMEAKRAFVVAAMGRLHGVQLVEPDVEVELPHAGVPARDLLLQWSDQDATPEPLQRKVAVGFSAFFTPETALSEVEPLACDSDVWLWCTVSAGELIPGAIGGGQALAPGIVDHAELEIAVFTNPDGFQVESRTGTLRLAGPTCVVLRHADIPPSAETPLIDSRLFFRTITPNRPGVAQLRVHLYHRGLLVQAINVLACIGERSGAPDRPAITAQVDYALSNALEERQLLALGEHTLSIFANESPGAMAGFRFFGADGEIVGSATVEASRITTLLETARQALRLASWGSTEAYQEARDIYRYEPAAPRPDLKEDLVRLAKCGFNLWHALAKSFAGDGDMRALQQAMRRPGIVHLGMKESSAQLLPLAILYDHPIEPALKNIDAFTVCGDFWERPDCLEGRCPNYGKQRVICPSGFWGFRHSIGVPVGPASVDATGGVAPARLRLFASAYAGTFPLRDSHLLELEKLVGAETFDKSLTYQETVTRMQQGGFQLLYLYCHGGMDGAIPYVLVGRDDEDPNQIVPATLLASGIEWAAPRTLVFINGCRTTALEPEQAIDLVNGFVETAHASGVIGTEVTVFEPLATKMAEAFIARLVAGADVGTALRDARRAMLRGDRPNPLGLVYIPFALATLKLEGLPASTSPATS